MTLEESGSPEATPSKKRSLRSFQVWRGTNAAARAHTAVAPSALAESRKARRLKCGISDDNTATRFATMRKPPRRRDLHISPLGLPYGVTRKRTIIWLEPRLSKVHDNEIRHANPISIGARLLNTHNNIILKKVHESIHCPELFCIHSGPLWPCSDTRCYRLPSWPLLLARRLYLKPQPRF